MIALGGPDWNVTIVRFRPLLNVPVINYAAFLGYLYLSRQLASESVIPDKFRRFALQNLSMPFLQEERCRSSFLQYYQRVGLRPQAGRICCAQATRKGLGPDDDHNQKRKAAKVALRCSPACTLPQVLRHLVRKISNYILTSGTCHANLHVFAQHVRAYPLPHGKSETYRLLPSLHRTFRKSLDVTERRAMTIFGSQFLS